MMVTKDIIAKWSHFSEQDVAALKGKADLVNQVAAKYGLEQAQAQRDVDAVLKGRQIGAGAWSCHSPRLLQGGLSVLFGIHDKRAFHLETRQVVDVGFRHTPPAQSMSRLHGRLYFFETSG